MSKVTILIPTYNQCHYLSEAIQSSLNQDYDDIEVVVVDDGSTDATSILVEQYISDPRFRYVRNDNNIGRVKNYRHALFNCAKGDYVLNLDGDDWLTDNKFISSAVDILDQNPGVGFVMARAQTYFECENRFEEQMTNFQSGIISGVEFLNNIFLDQILFAHLATVYRREDGIASDFYSVNSMWADGISFFLLSCQKQVAIIPRNVGVWRVHTKNESGSFYQYAQPKDLFELIELVVENCEELSPEVVRSYILLTAYHFVAWAAKHGHYSKIYSLLGYVKMNYPEYYYKITILLAGKLLVGLVLYIPRRLLKLLHNHSQKYFL